MLEGINLGSLEKGVVDRAKAASADVPVQASVTEPEVPEVPAVVPESSLKPEEIKPEETIPPVEKPASSPEEVAAALAKIESLGDEADLAIEQEGADDVVNIYPAVGTFLKEKGILIGEDDIKDEESFVGAIAKTIEDSKYSDLSPKQLSYLKALEAGIPDDQAAAVTNNLHNLEQVTSRMLDENEELAESLVRDDLVAQGWDEARANKQIDRLKITKELQSEGLIAKDNILARNEKFVEDARLANAKAIEDKEKADAAQIKELNDSVMAEKKALGVIEVTDKLRNEVYESMTKPVGYDETGNPMNALSKDRDEDPVGFERRMYYAYVLTNGFRDGSRLNRRAESSAARKFQEALKGSNLGLEGQGAGVVIPHAPPSTMPDIQSV